jgi:hypothetical protein
VKIPLEVLNDYHEALELFAYERMSLVKLGLSNIEEPTVVGGFAPLPVPSNNVTSMTPEQQEIYTTRLMLVVISALAKLAAR